MGSTTSAPAEGTRKTHSVTPMVAKCSSLPGSGIEPNGTISQRGRVAAGLGHHPLQLGDGGGQAGAADGDPALGVLGDVGEQLGPGTAADAGRAPAAPPAWATTSWGRSTRGRRRTPATSSRHSACMASTCSRVTARRSAMATPWSASSSSFHPKPMPEHDAAAGARWSRVATALAVTIGSRWAGRAMPVPRRDALGHRGGGGQGHERVEGALVLLGQLGLAGGRGRAAADGDVGVLGQVERVEASGLDLAGQGDDVHRLVGGEDGDPVAHAGTLALRHRRF